MLRYLAILLALGGVAHASPWKRRGAHLAITAAAGGVYIVSNVFKADIEPTSCRWCNPTPYDRSIRDALVWKDTGRAATFSDISGFALSSASAFGLIAFGSLADDDRLGTYVDDAIPIAESLIANGIVNQIVKLAVGEQRPFVRFGDRTRPHAIDDNLSFYSGHTSIAFSLATSAGMVAHLRHYKIEPVIWASGYTIAAATGYLRIAADRHYFTDVVVGAIAGSAAGIAIPTLFHRDILVVPTERGAALVGQF